jgi:hypothetical protein
LLFAGANKIPLRRDWALALLTVMLAILTLRPVLPAFVMDMYSDFCIAIIIILKYAAKVEWIFRLFVIQAEATRRHNRRNSKTPAQDMENSSFFISYFAGKLNMRISEDAQKRGCTE